ncbi:MAG TPA: oligosaccharide flippase family protein, partial [Steroidobacteraceae bacterium]|nr:oligosaccharide flippase family protein [Steroidobacteraceae bacterium]
ARRFRTHAAIETVAMLMGLAVTLLLALRGAGYWALFAAEPVTALCLLAGHTWAARWRPHFSAAISEVRHFSRFGGVVSLNRVAGYIAGNVDNLILGIAAGPVSLGFYNKAFRLVALPQEAINWPLSKLAIPILAQSRDQPAEFVRAFRHFNLTSVALALPAVGFLLVSTAEIVAVLYGPQWTPVVPLLRLLGLMGLCHTFLLAPVWVYTAMGTVTRQLRWDLLNLAVLAAAFLLGVRWGAMGVAIAASAAYAAMRIPALLYCFRGTPLRLRDLGAILWRPLLATAVAGGVLLSARRGWGTAGPAYLIVLRDALVFAGSYALGWLLVPGWKSFLAHELRRPAPTP